jgi:hypothetical protein
VAGASASPTTHRVGRGFFEENRSESERDCLVAFSSVGPPSFGMGTFGETTEGRASEVVAACELAWRTIQQHHRELPDVVVVLGSGVERGRLVKLGHWWAGRWEAGDELRGEVLLAGEALHLQAEDVFEVLLHEAAHGLNAARGVKDASRGGRYHNARYRATAIEVGLDVEQLAPHGWAKTTLSEAAVERYSAEIKDLRGAVRIARRLEAGDAAAVGADGTRDPESGRNTPAPSALLCECGRRMRMAPSVAAQGPVLCGLCGSEFATPGVEQRSAGKPADLVHLRPVGAEVPAKCDDRRSDLVLLQNEEGKADSAHLWARAAMWTDRHGERLDEVLIAADATEARTLNDLVRRFRREQAHLVGPDLAVGELAFAAGDQVIVATESSDSDGVVPGVGVLGQIVAVDAGKGCLTVDFPIAGRYRLSAEEAGRHLDYGYAVTQRTDRLPLPVVPEPIPDDDVPKRLADVIEIGLP